VKWLGSGSSPLQGIATTITLGEKGSGYAQRNGPGLCGSPGMWAKLEEAYKAIREEYPKLDHKQRVSRCAAQ
jgi:hypothetical protein